jgi:hypothetical protein
MVENIKPTLGLPKEEVTTPAPKLKAKSSDPIARVKASGRTFAEATQLVADGPWSIFDIEAKDQRQATDKLPFKDVQQGVILPVGAAIGDLVELYFTGYTGRVFTPEGDSFTYTDENASVDVGSSAMFRKITDKGWRYVAGA